MNRLVLSGLAVAAGSRRLLERLELELSSGEVLGLAGPSGIGKTALLRTLAALQDPAAGELRLNQRMPSEVGWPTWRRQVSYVAQQPVLLDTTVRDNLERPFRYRGTDGPFPLPEAQTLLERVGVAETLDQPARQLSVGQKQRVCLIRTLLMRPLFLLLDEPTGSLDPEAVASVEELLSERSSEEPLGVLIVSHTPDQLDRVAHRRIDLAEHRVEAA